MSSVFLELEILVNIDIKFGCVYCSVLLFRIYIPLKDDMFVPEWLRDTVTLSIENVIESLTDETILYTEPKIRYVGCKVIGSVEIQ